MSEKYKAVSADLNQKTKDLNASLSCDLGKNTSEIHQKTAITKTTRSVIGENITY